MPAGIEKRVLSLLGEVIGLLELDELSYGLLRGLREAVPSEFCAIHELPADLPHTVSLTDPPAPPRASAVVSTELLLGPGVSA